MEFHVGLLWHSLDSGNLGVRALTLAELALLDRVAKETGTRMPVTLFANPSDGAAEGSFFETDRVRVIETVPVRARDLSLGLPSLMRALRRCDLVIDIGEGDSFTDVYGGRRYLKQVASKLAVLAARRPLVLAPQTIGPFRGRANSRLPARILGRAAAVFARDEPSADYARSLAAGVPVVEAADLAFLLPFRKAPAAPDDRLRIGLNVSGLLYNQPAEDRRFSLLASYARLVDSLIDHFAELPGCELHLISHVAAAGGADEDSATCARLARSRKQVVLAPAFTDPRQAKAYIAGMDFFIGARMHACIAAFSAGVPLLPLAYTRKATGLFGSLGYPVVGDLTTAGEEELLRLACDTFENRLDLLPALASGNRRADERLLPYEAALARLVQELRR